MTPTKQLLIVLLLTSLSAFALGGSATLAWDASPSAAVTNYVLYAHTNSLNSTNLNTALVKVSAGTNLTVAITGLTPPTVWYFVATAQANGIQSDPSNQLVVQVPVAPANARMMAVQYAELNITNWTDVGFFRIRIGP